MSADDTNTFCISKTINTTFLKANMKLEKIRNGFKQTNYL